MIKASSVILVLILCLFSFFGGRYLGTKRISERVETVTVVRIDTVVREQVVPRKVVVDRIVLDTLYSKDTVFTEVYVPISTYIFEDSLYRAEVSGYKVSMDKIELFNRSSTTTVSMPVARPKRFGLGVQVGYGIGKNGLSPYVGVGLSYNALTF